MAQVHPDIEAFARIRVIGVGGSGHTITDNAAYNNAAFGISAAEGNIDGGLNLAKTIRLMAGQELATEGFKAGQVGSSAMPHKMNARSCERVTGLTQVPVVQPFAD